MIAQKIAENGGKPIDPKYLKEMAVSYMAVGGSDATGPPGPRPTAPPRP